MRKKLVFLLAIGLLALTLGGCGGQNANQPAAPPERPYVAVVSKGFQHQFWQTVYAGSQAAAQDFGVDITFEGPPSEADVKMQQDMLTAALAKKPVAICLAALDTKSLNSQLEAAKAAGVAVIGFDSGVPDAPEGVIASTASTNNYAAGALAAEEMFREATVQARLNAAAPETPVVIGVLSQDAVSESIVGRTRGFIDKLYELTETLQPGAVEVTGHGEFARAASGSVAITIKVSIPPTTEYSDAQISARNMLENTPNLLSVFCSNEGAVTGMLAATNDGLDLDRVNGVYKDLVVVGFDAGSTQKNAVRKQYFYGSVTQDPYQIGYMAIELACKVYQGETVAPVIDTGCKFYNYENIDNPDIAQLVYD